MPEIDKREQAVSAFESGDYREAFLSFVEIYETSKDGKEREMIFQILEEGYYQPNAEELLENYNKNSSLLAAYPYQWGFQECPAEALPVQIFPVTDTEYSLYDKKARKFSGLRVINSGQPCDYLFQDLSRPVFRENDCNLYHLQYLEDNVRRSEDYGGDNHIYLYYAGLRELAPLLFLGELDFLFERQKPVFLIGEANKRRYPVDFKKEFQLDYASMGPVPVRIEEIKRVCFWYKHAYCGTMLSLGVIGSLNEVQMYYAHDFHTYSTVNGGNICATKRFRDAVSNFNTIYTVGQLSEMSQSKDYKLVLDGLKDFLNWLRQQRPAPHAYTVKELFCGYFLFQYEKRNLNPRIAPMLLYDPHIWDSSMYTSMILSFPYHSVLTSAREPITTFVRLQQNGIAGWNEFQTKYLLAYDYAHAQFLRPELRSCYYGFRFEDLKAKPEITCRALCRHLDLPYDKVMLETDAPLEGRDHTVVRGFDTAPLKRDLSASLSEFDMVRLKMFYEPIQRYYGYPTFSFQEHPLPEGLVRELFKYPFRFEHVNPQIYGKSAPPPETFHTWIQTVLQKYWRGEFIAPKLIPVEDPGGQKDGSGNHLEQPAAGMGNRRARRAARKR